MHSGRLELTWTNKNQALLTAAEGTYEWVPPADYRVSEVRLLHTVDAVGDTPPERDRANLLIRGDALHGLRALKELPEFTDQLLGKIRLAYIDPPFNTGQAFADYDDALEHSVWLTMMRDRIRQIHGLLAPNGSIWVHLDDVEVHRCRAVLDEEFGPDNFVAEVAWQKADSPRSDSKGISISHDSILVYRRSGEWEPNRIERRASTDAAFGNQDGDPTRWRKKDPTAPGAKTHQGMVYGVQHPLSGQLVYPGIGRCWAMDQQWMVEQMSEYASYELRDIGDSDRRSQICGVEAGEVREGVLALMLAEPLEAAAAKAQKVYDAGTWPELYLTGSGDSQGIQRKQHINDDGRVPETWWPHTEVGHNRSAKNQIKALFPGVHPFATPKPEELLQRIIHIGTDPGDIVLDCFAGSGTTAAVAHKMNRRWLTIEASAETVARYTLPRLKWVVEGADDGGISTVETPTGEGLPDSVAPGACRDAAKTLDAMRKAESLDLDDSQLKAVVKALRDADRTSTERVWSGGGGFIVIDIGPSMFEQFEGRIYLADWAVNGALAEASAAQLGYTYELDAPFCGYKGKSRLAVIDGLVSEAVVRLLVDALPPGEKLTVAGTALDPAVREVLRSISPGSSARKVPESLLDEYRQSRRTLLRLAAVLDDANVATEAS